MAAPMPPQLEAPVTSAVRPRSILEDLSDVECDVWIGLSFSLIPRAEALLAAFPAGLPAHTSLTESQPRISKPF